MLAHEGLRGVEEYSTKTQYWDGVRAMVKFKLPSFPFRETALAPG